MSVESRRITEEAIGIVTAAVYDSGVYRHINFNQAILLHKNLLTILVPAIQDARRWAFVCENARPSGYGYAKLSVDEDGKATLSLGGFNRFGPTLNDATDEFMDYEWDD